MSTTKKITLVVTTVAAAAALATGLAACSSGGSSTPTATKTVTTTAQPTATTTTAPSASSTPSSGSTGGTGGTGTVSACTTANLSGAIVAGSGGAAGSTYVDLTLTNKGTAACTLQGWPGVSFVGSGNGTQIGAAAKFNESSAHPTVTVAAGSSTKAVLQIVQAGNYDNATCSPATADGFRVYPPGQKASLYIAYPSPACSAKGVDLLTVGAFE